MKLSYREPKSIGRRDHPEVHTEEAGAGGGGGKQAARFGGGGYWGGD